MSRCPVKLRDFPTNHARDLTPIKFFESVTLKTFATSCSEMYREPLK